MAKRKRGKKRGDFQFEDFRVLGHQDKFPDRLAEMLRLLFHIDKTTWDFCLDRLRQHKAGKSKAYTTWSKSKGKGRGRRYFAAPCPELKVVQKMILDHWLYSIPVHFCRHGNQKGTSFLTVLRHHGADGFAKAVFSIDLINAFPSVFRSRVKSVLIKPLRFALDQFGGTPVTDEDFLLLLEAVCDLLTFEDRVVDYRAAGGRIPQGPPTSPRLFDICSYQMDRAIFEYLAANSTIMQSYRYTAYVDNLEISSNQEIPEAIRTGLLAVIRDNGFIPHSRPDKCKYYSPQTGEVPVILGLVLGADGHVTMTPRKRNQLRARLFNYLRVPDWDEQIRGELAGLLGYIRSVYPAKLPSQLRDVVTKVEVRFNQPQIKVSEPAVAAVKKPIRPKKSKVVKKPPLPAKESKTPKAPAGDGQAKDLVIA